MTVPQRRHATLCAAVASISRIRAHLAPTRGDIAGTCICVLAALFFTLYAACGFPMRRGSSPQRRPQC